MIHARADYERRIVDAEDLIPELEPVLFLRGQDACALATIDAWLEEAEHQGVDERMIGAMEQHRDRVAAWQEAGNVKVPDLPPRPPRRARRR